MNQLAEDLKAVRETIDKGWCQYAFAKDAEGEPVSWQNNRAVKFCLTGAIVRCTGIRSKTVGDAIRSLSGDLYKCYNFANWNDMSHRTKEDVLRVIDKTIANEE